MNKVDFVAILVVDGANPNGDPLGGNTPRTCFDGRGEISDVCLKHKIRKRFDAMAKKPADKVLLVGTDYGDKRSCTIQERLEKYIKLKMTDTVKGKEKETFRENEDIANDMCKEFRDVRCFGYTLALKGKKDKDGDGEKGNGLSIGISGPVTIQTAKSVAPINPVTTQITKCMSMDGGGSDTMGTKYRVDQAAYVIKGTVNARLAEKTGMTEDDVTALKEAIKTLCWDDESAARPSGSMEVKALYWMTHNCKLGNQSSASAQRAIEVQPQKEYPYFTATVHREKINEGMQVEQWNDEKDHM